tara:strand:- start:1504 stop:2028 length:525 start_codon:yes stop_codon:yes gene_type:complete
MKSVEDYNFNTDINVGEKGESIISNFLISHGCKFINDNKDNKYDLKMLTHNNIPTTIEIKTDVYCYPERTVISENNTEEIIKARDTGNMFIEKECRGKLSGISVSKSRWFVMYYPYFKQAWFIRTGDLRNLIESNNFYVATGGDPGSNTKGYLIKRNFFKKHFKVKTIDEEWED